MLERCLVWDKAGIGHVSKIGDNGSEKSSYFITGGEDGEVGCTGSAILFGDEASGLFTTDGESCVIMLVDGGKTGAAWSIG